MGGRNEIPWHIYFIYKHLLVFNWSVSHIIMLIDKGYLGGPVTDEIIKKEYELLKAYRNR